MRISNNHSGVTVDLTAPACSYSPSYFFYLKMRVALLILLVAVFGISGSYLALYLTHTPLNVGSYTGLIMIVGIIGENAIFTFLQFRESLNESPWMIRCICHFHPTAAETDDRPGCHHRVIALGIGHRNRRAIASATGHRRYRRFYLCPAVSADHFAGHAAHFIQTSFCGNYRITTDLDFTFTKMNTMKYLNRVVVTVILFSYSKLGLAQMTSGYKLSKTFKIASGGGWDYIAVNDHKLYVSHATQVNILDASNGDSLGVIPGTTGVHGIAFIPALGKGYVSCGRLNIYYRI